MDNEVKKRKRSSVDSLNLSFKEDEAWLRERIRAHTQQSGYVKDVLAKHERRLMEEEAAARAAASRRTVKVKDKFII